MATTLRSIASLATFLVVASPAAVQGDATLQNDGFISGGSAGFEGGFLTGEAGASRFVAPDAGRQLLKVQLLYGPDSMPAGTMYPVTLKVWDDSSGTDVPGAELDDMDFDLQASSTAMQEIDVSGDNVIVPQQFRVGIVFQHDGAPSIARDNDGTIAASKNFILANGTTWVKSQALGLAGDWIIRAVINGTGGGGNPDAGVPMDAPATGGTCSGNTQCPTGQFCDLTNHTCTFECRTSADCGGGTCNSLGMCVNANNGGGGGGCCEADGRRGGALASLLAFGVLLRLRRRRA